MEPLQLLDPGAARLAQDAGTHDHRLSESILVHAAPRPYGLLTVAIRTAA